MTMVTDFDIYQYISIHLDEYQKVIDRRIEFAKKHEPIFLKGDGYYTIPNRNKEKLVTLEGSNGDSIQYQFSEDEYKLICVYINVSSKIPYEVIKTYAINPSYLSLFDLVDPIAYNQIDTEFILLEESKLPSEMLLGNIKAFLPMFDPFRYQEVRYIFDLMLNGSIYYFRIKLAKNADGYEWNGYPIGYSNIGYELGKHFHLLVSDIREMKSIPRECVEILIERLREEI